ncbi:MAG TPA: protein kinase [Pyrinomonadaceae bacterium]|nr:protein kinase [Pyrinomonadaceae bacterium]
MNKEFAANTTLSHYRIVSKIGEGGMGEVYLAEDTKLGRKVAIKFLNEEFSRDEDKLNRFVREAKAASALNHPNILTVYEIGEVDARNYIATELIDGHTLREHLAQKEALPLNRILKIGVQVAEALSAAHQAGIIHRDIKPENIMIRRDGYAKVLDFGLAKLSEPPALEGGSTGSEAATRMQINTNPGIVMGTVSYMSPEQARGNPTDARTDIWSLGVVLYEMLARKVPFTGDTTSHTIVAIIEKEPLALEDVPAELQRIVRKTLTKDADMRYQTARDLLIDLKNLRRDLDIQGEIERSIVPNRDTGAISESATQVYSSGSMTRTASAPSVVTQPSTSSLEYAVTQVKSHKLVTAIVAVVLLAGVAAGGYFAFFSKGSSAGQISSIAVMPFVNEGGKAELEYLADGMTDTLISSLSQVPNLSVKARSSVFRYKGKETDPQTIAKELNVQAILNGRIAQRGDQLTLTLELVDPQSENVLWSEQYTRKESDIVALQSEVARSVSTKLRSRLSGPEAEKVAKTYTANPEAYQFYLKGLFHWNKRTAESLKTAIDFFNQAIAKDPNYAQAYAGLGMTYVLLPEYSAGKPEEAMPKGKAAARKALDLDDTLPEAHAALAMVLFKFERNVPESEREFLRAIELNPNFATAHQWYAGATLVATGRFDRAIAEGRRAVELDPMALIPNVELAAVYSYARRHDEAIAQLRRVIDMDPDWYLAHMLLCVVYGYKGQFAEAIAEGEKARRLNDDPAVLGYLAQSLALSGKREEAMKIVAQLHEVSKQRYVPAFSFGIVYAALGDKDQALQWMERCLQDSAWEITLIKVDPAFDNLRSDPRFNDLVKRVGI